MQFTRRGSFAAAIALGAAMFPWPCRPLAEDGVTADTIVFGQAAVLEGPASALGLGMQNGPAMPHSTRSTPRAACTAARSS